jgi:predicted transport protein
MGIFTTSHRLPEVTFNLEKDFEEEVYENSKLLFGEKSILLDTKTLLKGNVLGGTIPDGFLFDLSDETDPQFYLIEVELAKHSFNSHIFPQITKFFAFFKNQEQRQKLTLKLYEIISSDNTLRNEFKKYIGDQEIYKFINDIIENSQNILIIIDGEKPDIADISEVYTDTWGKMVKHIVLKKYSDGNESVYHLEPDLEILEIVGDEQAPEGKTKYDEAHHTDGINDTIVSIYRELKDRVLKINPNLIFNPTKFYISIRGRKSYAFIKMNNKKMTLIPMASEDEIRGRITKYQVKSVPESVMKFWNGECAHIIIQDADGMDELTDILSLAVEEED